MANEFLVAAGEVNERVDLFLAGKMRVSRAEARRMLAAGAVSLNGHPIGEKQKGMLLRVGSKLSVGEVKGATELEVVPRADMALSVLAQGEGWVIVDKPAGVATHPLEAGEEGTVLNAVAGRWPEIQGVGEAGLRSGVVHRLDLDTTGTLCFATSPARWTELRRAFQSHATKKVYRAIVAGQLEGTRGVRALLHVARHSPAKVGVVDPTQGEAQYPGGTRDCSLSYRSLDVLAGGATLLEIELQTGFLHQIRVMMANLGHPVLGDQLYGGEEVGRRAPRQMLHAAFLRVTGDVQATSPDPGDFAGVLERLRV